MVHAHDEHGGVGAGGRDDDSLGASLQVSLEKHTQIKRSLMLYSSRFRDVRRCGFRYTVHIRLWKTLSIVSGAGKRTYGCLLDGGEHAGGLHHVLGTSIAPLDVGWVPPGSTQSERDARSS